jgi:hypothetical protein
VLPESPASPVPTSQRHGWELYGFCFGRWTVNNSKPHARKLTGANIVVTRGTEQFSNLWFAGGLLGGAKKHAGEESPADDSVTRFADERRRVVQQGLRKARMITV